MKDEATFKWSDGWPVDYSNWAAGNPPSNNDDKDCVTMATDGTWHVATCEQRLPFLCKQTDGIYYSIIMKILKFKYFFSLNNFYLK